MEGNTMNKDKVIDIIVRTARTFFEGALAYLIADIKYDITDFDNFKRVLLTLLVGALSAGICAVINLFLAWCRAYMDVRESRHITETYSEDEADGEEYDTEVDDDGE